MKKQFIYAGMFLFTIGFSACNEDFKDWAAPQSNPQEDSAEQMTATFTTGQDANISMDEATADSVEIVKLTSTTAVEGSTITLSSLLFNDDYSLPFTTKDGTVKVALTQLDSITQEIYKSRASVARNLRVIVKAAATTPAGDGIQLSGNEVNITLKPGATPAVDPKGYYVVGAFTGWNAEGALPMTLDPNNKNVYTLETETTEANQNFKIFPASAINGKDIDWAQALGAQKDGDTAAENFLTWKVGDKEAGAVMVEEAGKIKITINMTDFRYSVKDNSAPTELYMTGSAYNWGKIWKQFVPVNDTKGAFWGIYYFAADDQVKFAPQADWGNDFGFAATISQASVDRAGLSDSDGNIKVGKAGWYLVYVSVIGDNRVVEFETPNVYLIGDTSHDGWNDQLAEQDLFTIPTDADGSFVSPAFAKNGELRICVHPEAAATDWWRTEFIILNGKIEYRGNDGDQERVQGKAGQKAYLNFSDNTGKVE